MESYPHAEFAQFRFVRDGSNNVISLPSQGIDERNLLVVDYDRWALARLHIFEEAAIRKDKLEAFQEELAKIANLRSSSLTRLVSWGRDGEELFYADEMLDGEPLPEYLGRTGGVPFAVAAEWIVQLIGFFEGVPPDLPSFERFSTLNFQVILGPGNDVRPVFSEFFGWTKPGAQVQEHTTEWSLAQIFCSLIAGVPVRTFHDQSLPRNFDELDDAVRRSVLDALSDGKPDAFGAFETEMRRLSETAERNRDEVSLPKLPVRDWLRRELEDSYPGEPEYSLSEEFSPDEERYGLPAVIRGTRSCVQLLPGPEYLPREGWLNQHHRASRRVGRAMMHQLHVNHIEDRGVVTLIGEEQIDGVDLGSLIREMGKRAPEEAALIGNRIAATLDSLESKVGACAVWWLPPENILIATGSRSISGSIGLLSRKGERAWEELPVKLRLHQTTRTLRKGVSLPGRIRRLSREPGKPFRDMRREAIALPLFFFLLTGERFRWRQPVAEQAELPAGITTLLEQSREQLLSDTPEEIEGDLFVRFSGWVAGSDDSEEIGKTGEESNEDFERMLKETLYEGTIDLTGVEGIPKPPPESVTAAEEPEETEDDPGDVDDSAKEKGFPDDPVDDLANEGNEAKEPPADCNPDDEDKSGAGKPEPFRRPWWKFWSAHQLWMGFFAVVAATVTGFFLSGWNSEKGKFATVAVPEFPASAYQPLPVPTRAEVMQKLESFLILSARPDLIVDARQWDQPGNQEAVRTYLGERVEEFDPEAAYLEALLAEYDTEGKGTVSEKLSRAAELGHAEAQLRIAEMAFLEKISGVDPGLAGKYLQQAASVGNAPASVLRAALLHEEGRTGEAVDAVAPAAREGSPAALLQLGFLHTGAETGEADPGEALRCFQKAAVQGDPRAMYFYARCLESGFGAEASFTEATRWMKLAAGAGSGAAARWCQSRGIELDPGPPVARRE